MKNNASKSGGARIRLLNRVGGGVRVDSSREASRGGKNQRGQGRRGQSETETGGSRCGRGLSGCTGSSFDCEGEGDGRQVRQQPPASSNQNKQRRNVSQV